VSPVNSDDASGRNFRTAGRPLTRKEIRAREKSLTADSGDLVPEHAYESEDDVPDVPDHPPAAPPQRAPQAPAPARVEQPLPAAVPAPVPAASVAPIPSADVVAPTVGVPLVPPVSPTIQPTAGHHVPHEAVPVPHEDAADIHDSHGAHAAHGAQAADALAADTHDGHAHGAHKHAAHAAPAHVASSDVDAGGAYLHADEIQHSAVHGEDDYAAYHHDAHHEAAYEDHEPYEQEAVGHQLLGRAESVTAVARPSKKVRRRRRLVALLLTLALFVTAAVVGAQFLKPLLGGGKLSDYPGPGTGQVKVSVLPGEGPVSVAAKLEEARVVANADTFVAALAASDGTLNPGEYDFKQEMKNEDAVAVLLNEGQSKVMYVALNAGLRINESLEAISEGSGIPVAQFKALSDSPQQFGLPAKAKNLEGFLAPGEHRFPLGSTPKDILTALVKVTKDELKAQGVTDPVKQYDVITVASIVQAEGGQAEYKDVAGAIYNRLKPNNTETAGLIQSDATVTYGLGRKSFHIDEDEKADKSNPYNTYAIPGLPVGPIGSPGKTAIDAAAKPKKNEYMYWVTINLDTKETKFSKTLEEHQRYVDQYNVWCEANPGRCV
jgi:UPF0755 protein